MLVHFVSFEKYSCVCRSIEDNIYAMCGDIILNCIVVGNGRPFPALFVELRDGVVADGVSEEDVKKDILKRTEGFREMLCVILYLSFLRCRHICIRADICMNVFKIHV
jgi:hypothetical protein